MTNLSVGSLDVGSAVKEVSKIRIIFLFLFLALFLLLQVTFFSSEAIAAPLF